MSDPGFYSIPSAPLDSGQSDRILMRQARTQPSSLPTRFSLADGIIDFRSSDILDLGGGTMQYSLEVYSKAFQNPGYIPHVFAEFHPGGLASTFGDPLPLLDVNQVTGNITTILQASVQIDATTSEMKVKIFGQSRSATFGSQSPGPTSVFSYFVLDGAADGLLSKV